MDLLGAVRWVAENGGEHIELSPAGWSFGDSPELVEEVKAEAAKAGIEISSYTIGANFIQESSEAVRAEIDRVKKEVDIGGALGVKLMRHDAASRPIPETSIEQFEKDLPGVVEACREVAEHAAQYGITTSVENHGYHMQGSERVSRLILGVGRENYRTTLDVGNFLCADEDPLAAVANNMKYASHVHLKDFYIRDRDPGEGWFRSRRGRYLRGAIVGQGDIDMPAAIRLIKESGYDGFISIEFEGMEDCRTGSRIGMANARRIWDEV
jgi:sugar phosphate isomerase/epimerase